MHSFTIKIFIKANLSWQKNMTTRDQPARFSTTKTIYLLPANRYDNGCSKSLLLESVFIENDSKKNPSSWTWIHGRFAEMPPSFWQISYPYSNRGSRLCPPHYYRPPRFLDDALYTSQKPAVFLGSEMRTEGKIYNQLLFRQPNTYFSILNPWCHLSRVFNFYQDDLNFPPILPPKHLQSAPVRSVPAQFQLSGRASRLVFVLILPSQKFFSELARKSKLLKEQKNSSKCCT